MVQMGLGEVSGSAPQTQRVQLVESSPVVNIATEWLSVQERSLARALPSPSCALPALPGGLLAVLGQQCGPSLFSLLV